MACACEHIFCKLAVETFMYSDLIRSEATYSPFAHVEILSSQKKVNTRSCIRCAKKTKTDTTSQLAAEGGKTYFSFLFLSIWHQAKDE